MKLTKRMKSSIIQGMIANIFFFIVLTLIALFFLYPHFAQIEGKKSTLKATYSKLQNIAIQGI
jgi:hypothetical protein